MGSTTAAGSTLALSASFPATRDAAGYGALIYVEVGSVEKIGGIGASYAKTEFQPLKGAKQKYKGSADFGSLQPSIAIDDTDAGQVLLNTAADDEANKLFAFRVIKPDGAIRYFLGRVFGNPETIDTADAMIMGNPTIEICSRVVKVPASTGGTTPTPVKPDAPTLAVTAGNGQNVLTFADGAAGTSPITAHNLYRSTASGTPTLVGQITTGSPYIDTGLSNGTKYNYQLTAVSAAGESTKSTAVSATPAVIIAPRTRLAGVSAGQSLGAYPYLRGNPRVAKFYAQTLRGLFGFTAARDVGYYNSGQFFHDGATANATDWTIRLDNFASGGSVLVDQNFPSYISQQVTVGGNTFVGNHWKNTQDNSATTGNAADVAGAPGPLWRNLIAGIQARVAAGYAPDFFDWSQGTSDMGFNYPTGGGGEALYKQTLKDLFAAVRTAAGNPNLPIFMYRNGRHQVSPDAGAEGIDRVQTQIAAEMAGVYIAAEEYPYRFATTGFVTDGATTLGSNVVTMADTSKFGANSGVEGAGIPEGAYVNAAPTSTTISLSVRQNGAVVPANATATASGVTVSNLDNVHLYPGSDGQQPYDTPAGAPTAHDTTQGFYAVRKAGANFIAKTLGAANAPAQAQGPYVSGAACQRGQNTVLVTITHVAGTDFTIGDATGWYLGLDGVQTTITSVAKISSTQVQLTVANDIYAANVTVEYAYGAMNRAVRTQFIFDNAGYPMQRLQPITAATSVQTTYEAETTALTAAMTTAPSTNRKVAIDRRIARLKAGGVWALLDVNHMLAAADEQAALLDWKDPTRSVTKVGAPIFTADRGFTGTGAATDYLDLGYNPSANSGASSKGLGLNDVHVSAFALTTGSSSSAMLIDANSRTGVRARSGTGAYAKANSSTTTAMTDGVAVPCQVTANRLNDTNQQGLRNGVLVVDVAAATTGLPGNFTAFKSSDQQGAELSVGRGVTPAQDAAMTAANVQYLRAVGAIA